MQIGNEQVMQKECDERAKALFETRRTNLKERKSTSIYAPLHAKTATAAAATARPEVTRAAESRRKLVAPLVLLDEEPVWLDELAEEEVEARPELAGEEDELELLPDEPDELELEPEPDEEPVVSAEPEAAAEPVLLRHEVSEPARTVTSPE